MFLLIKSNAEAFYYIGLIEFENEEYSVAIEDFNRDYYSKSES